MFAVMFLPSKLPNFWNIALEFATSGKFSQEMCVSEDQARALMENLRELNSSAFDSDKVLFYNIVDFEVPGKPLGVPLLSANTICLFCHSTLVIRKDRFSPIVIYDDVYGTIPGSHFHKYCTNRLCSFVQYYDYYSYNSSIWFALLCFFTRNSFQYADSQKLGCWYFDWEFEFPTDSWYLQFYSSEWNINMYFRKVRIPTCIYILYMYM